MIHEIYPHRFNNQYLTGKNMYENDFVFHFKDNKLLLKTNGLEPEIPRKRDFSEIKADSIYLFSLDEVSCFLLWDDLNTYSECLVYSEISFFRTVQPKETGWIALVAYHLWKWYSDHKFCGKCGAQTKHKTDERALVCTQCDNLIFPKISPAVIVAITCKDKLLLAGNAGFTGGWYSLIAGYVDIGETLEETVIREVKEEVGLNVHNIRYYKSQPWALSGTLMVGFIAEADENQSIVVDGLEITKANWFRKDELPPYPSNASISGEIIEKFKNGIPF